MTNAQRDENNVPTMIAVLDTDGVTIGNIKVNPANHRMKISDDTTGTDYGRDVAHRDENNVPVLMGVSSADGVTPVEIYRDSNGFLLINSN